MRIFKTHRGNNPHLINFLFNFIGADDCKKQLVFGAEHKVKDEHMTASSIWDNQASLYGPQNAKSGSRLMIYCSETTHATILF